MEKGPTGAGDSRHLRQTDFQTSSAVFCTDLLAAGVRRDDLYTDRGSSGARAHRPALEQALRAPQEGDTLTTITTLDRDDR